MNTGYSWPVVYTRRSQDGRCETLHMELQFSVYTDTKDIFIYFCETDNKKITRSYVYSIFTNYCRGGLNVSFIICWAVDTSRSTWHIELGLSQKKLGFLSEKVCLNNHFALGSFLICCDISYSFRSVGLCIHS